MPPGTIEIGDTTSDSAHYQPDNFWWPPLTWGEHHLPSDINAVANGDAVWDHKRVGNDVYNRSGEDQTLNFPRSTPGGHNEITFFMQNDGSVADSFTVTASGGTESITGRYHTHRLNEQSTDVTNQITGGGLLLRNIAPQSGDFIELAVQIDPQAENNEKTTFTIRTISNSNPLAQDVIKMKVTVHK
jgi:hypothetical protein